MTSQKKRREFNVLDAMILIAATAIGLAGAKVSTTNGGNRRPALIFMGNDLRNDVFSTPTAILDDIQARGFLYAPIHLIYWVQVAGPFLQAWCVALLVLHLRKPHPRRRTLLCRPGFVAIYVTVAVLLAQLACWILLLMPSLWGFSLVTASLWNTLRHEEIWLCGWFYGNIATGMAVAAAWSAMAFGGVWRTEPSWLDRSSRILGVAWIASTPLYFWNALILY